MKILIAGFQHETNTFAPSEADWDSFVEGGGMPGMVEGEALLDFKGINLPLGGFLDDLEGEGHEYLPVIWASASPSGKVTKDAFERIVGKITDALKQETPDAIYLDIHGAMVVEHVDDGEGELLKRVRELVGDEVPVVGSLDLHANVSHKMLKYADALVAYRTYPHVDMDETGSRAAKLLKLRMDEKKRRYCAFKRIPFLIPINAQCTDLEPAIGTYSLLEKLEAEKDVILSFTPGFPASDFLDCGALVWGYGQDAQDTLDAVNQLAAWVESKESEWWVDLLDPDQSILEAIRISESSTKPVVIADSQDNPGAGGNSNTTGMLRALLRHDATDAAIGMIYDPKSALAATRSGEGSSLKLALGGEPALNDQPLEDTFLVEKVSDGVMTVKGPMMKGAVIELGPTVCLRKNGVRIVVGSRKAQMLDREMFRIAGIEPESMRILVNKSSVHFRADFTPIAETILVAQAPGPMPADPSTLPWKNLGHGIRIKPEGEVFQNSNQNPVTFDAQVI